jgi:hypothetical protein
VNVPFDPLPLLDKSGVSALDAFSSVDATTEALRRYVGSINGEGPLNTEKAKVIALKQVKVHKVQEGRALVLAAFREREAHQADTATITVKEPEPWETPVEGAEWLERVRALYVEYLALPDGAADYLAVFALVSYVQDAFNVAPYVAVLSPAPECGKTRLLEITELVVRRPWRPAVLTGPVLFRGIEMHTPTLLLDEAEVVRGLGEAAENVRAILHVGYRRGAVVERCVGEDFALRSFDVFGPKVFAAIGELPPTLLSRCVVLPMRRRGPGERVGWYRPQSVAPVGLELQRRALRWAADHRDGLRALEVRAPAFLGDRRAEVWEPLFAVAHLVGGEWLKRIEKAARILSGGTDKGTEAEELLRDIQAVRAARGGDRISSADLASALNDLEGHPWADRNRGNGIRANQVSRMLGDFGVSSGTIREGDKTSKGYYFATFADAFARYLPPAERDPDSLPPQESVTPSQRSQDGHDLDLQTVTQGGGVTVPEPEIMASLFSCDGVTVLQGGMAGSVSLGAGPGLEDVPLPPEPDDEPSYETLEREAIQGDAAKATDSRPCLVGAAPDGADIPLPPEPQGDEELVDDDVGEPARLPEVVA